MAVLVSACSGVDLSSIGGTPPPAAAATEQARLRLIDQCMFDLAASAGPQEKTEPVCQCYARGSLRESSGASLRGSDILAQCRRNPSAFAQARPRAAKPGPPREQPAGSGAAPKPAE
jgi:hypothetical protein